MQTLLKWHYTIRWYIFRCPYGILCEKVHHKYICVTKNSFTSVTKSVSCSEWMVAIAGGSEWLDSGMNREFLSWEETGLGNGRLKFEKKSKCTCVRVSLPVADGLIYIQSKFKHWLCGTIREKCFLNYHSCMFFRSEPQRMKRKWGEHSSGMLRSNKVCIFKIYMQKY
jgi:hypothetical protein